MFNPQLQDILIRLPVLLLSLTLHEIAHGFAAFKLGDLTAKKDGRLSLNPIRHIDPLGLLLLLVARFGWAKPVMVDPRNLKNPKKDMAIISLAGPLTNFVLSVLFFIPWFVLQINELPLVLPEYFYSFLELGIFFNISLALFNLLPLPPLDGSKIFGSLLPDHIYNKTVEFNPRIGIGILFLLSFTGLLGKIIIPMIIAVFDFYKLVALLLVGLLGKY